MAFVETENGALVVCEFNYSGKYWTNHIWCSKSEFDTDDQQDLVDAVKSTWETAMLGYYDTNTVIGTFKCYDMRTVDGPVVDDTEGPASGTGVVETLSLNNAIVLTLYTAKRGRAHRGRLYLTGYMEDQMEDTVWLSTLVTTITTFGGTMKTAITAEGWVWGVRSKQVDEVPRDPYIITPITTTTCRNNGVASQRRRTQRP